VTARLVEAALERCATRPVLYFYGVWLDVRGAAADAPAAREASRFDVLLSGAERKRKRHAILAHRSQTSDLIDDDPAGFRIDAAMLESWTGPLERFYLAAD